MKYKTFRYENEDILRHMYDIYLQGVLRCGSKLSDTASFSNFVTFVFYNTIHDED